MLEMEGLPPMPAGWKPGDPLPDLADLPPMPPGWKPGDELPEIAKIGSALGELPDQAPKEGAAAPKTSARVLPSAFDFILNPDYEEVEEDYSSDEDDEEEE